MQSDPRDTLLPGDIEEMCLSLDSFWIRFLNPRSGTKSIQELNPAVL